MPAVTDIGTLIVSTPGICGGRPRIAGTRVSVQNIAIDDRNIPILYLYGHDQIKDPARRAAVLQDVESAGERAKRE